MRKIVAPRRWIDSNRAEQPPLMAKWLFQAVCGGLRWLEAKELAEHMAKRALEEGYAFGATKEEYDAFGVPRPKGRSSRRKRSARRGKQHSEALEDDSQASMRRSSSTTSSSHAPNSLTVANNSLIVRGEHSLIPTKTRRLVQYDVLDCTFGGGFHSGVVLENGAPYTRVVALDCDYDATTAAREIVAEFGDDRFRLFGNRMSEAKAMFGESAFDAIMIDLGPSHTQLSDPARGFQLFDEDEHALDLRYGPQNGTSALDYLNSVEQNILAAALASYKILTPQQSMKLARCIRTCRPFRSSRQVLEALERAGDELPEEGWEAQLSRRKTPMSMKFLVSLRGIVNSEMFELKEALESSFLLLRTNGRVVVFTREPWEEELVRATISNHPHALLAYSERIDIDNVSEFGHSRHTQMWVATRVKDSAFVMRNAAQLDEKEVEESSLRWMTGMYAGQTHGFPANNLTFKSLNPEEYRIIRANRSPVPKDHGESDK